jgi:hypothetical protein
MQPDEPPQPPPLRLPDWDPATSYITQLQVRMPPRLFDRLKSWAEASEMSKNDLVKMILEDAVRLRDEAREAQGRSDVKPT